MNHLLKEGEILNENDHIGSLKHANENSFPIQQLAKLWNSALGCGGSHNLKVWKKKNPFKAVEHKHPASS